MFCQRNKETILQWPKINGLSSIGVLRKHMIPHVVGNVMVLATLDVGKVILMIASLSYIGLGAQPPAPEWGAMLNEGKAFLSCTSFNGDTGISNYDCCAYV
ncbi:hypothetical protein GCM10020331_085870 [Ectobacillus funiculus]